MIPFFSWQTITLGPLTLQVWGLFVSLGAIAALALSLRLAKNIQLNSEVIWDLFVWLLIGGIVGARIFYVIYYAPAQFYADPAEIFRVWHGGASSLGGFVGAFAALLIYARRGKIKFADFKPYADILSVSFWLGWAIGRVGCFLIHDHPGRLTNFILAVNFSAGPRHDLGLYESLFSLLVFGAAIFLYRKYKNLKPGRTFFWSFLVYGTGRFALDFLRAADLGWSDPRYFFLTPAQWGIFVFFILTAIVFLRKILRAWKTLKH